MSGRRTDVPSLFRSYREALESEDLPRAVEAAVSMEETEAEPTALVEDFVAAVRNDELGLARTLLQQIGSAYERLETAEQAQIQRAITAVEEGSLSASKEQQLLKLTRTATQASLTRSAFLNQSIARIESEKLDETTVVDTAKQAKNVEQELSTAKDTTGGIADGISVSPTPTVLTNGGPETVARGESAALTVTVGNVGNDETDALSLEADAESGLSVRDESVSIRPLSSDAREEVAVSVVGDTAGERTVTLDLKRGDSTVESVTQTITVLNEAKSVREAVVGGDRTVPNETEIQQSIAYWTEDEVIPGTGGKSITTEKLQEFITEWVESKGGSS
ncbi:COG1361 family protein [Halorussus salinus]|uniref:hypothetical protein n=1 Tax=Halorussus salinus TaxID=1364935 RepID=UPI001091D14C|nr:hypothetical protein [Halorussus salinus]